MNIPTSQTVGDPLILTAANKIDATTTVTK